MTSTDLTSLRKVERAHIYKNRQLAATLTRTHNHVEFRYLKDYIQATNEPVATSLPVSDDAIRTPPNALPAFFAGLLPEGRRLQALRTALKTSADDEFSLLLGVGDNTIGDVQVVPEGMPPEASPEVFDISSAHKTDFYQVFAKAIGTNTLDRVALPGQQHKVSARMMTAPVTGAGASYILKLNPPEYPHLVENEAFFLRACTASGIRCAQAKLLKDAKGQAALLVTRFDRGVHSDRSMAMYSQEDGCQVVHRYPADKYRVTTEELFTALINQCPAGSLAAQDLVVQCCFAYLTCNGDAHAKNFSILQRHNEWRIAPAYDIPSSYPYGDHTMALSIGGKNPEDLGRGDFLALSDHLGLSRRAANKAITRCCEASESWLPKLDSLVFDERTIHKLRRAIIFRRDRLSK